jgi:hypothetical protein
VFFVKFLNFCAYFPVFSPVRPNIDLNHRISPLALRCYVERLFATLIRELGYGSANRPLAVVPALGALLEFCCCKSIIYVNLLLQGA